MGLIVTWLITSLAVWVAAAVLPGFQLKNAKSALLVAAIFGLLNALLGKLLLFLLGLVTLGLAWLFAFITRWILNALFLVITDKLTDHLKIEGFGTALLGALLISVVSYVTDLVVRILF
jgi:putative membrane protein